MLKLADYDYPLPKELIASHPKKNRTQARLLCVSRDSKQVNHQIFENLPGHLRAGDVLVLNDTRVIPARLYGQKSTGGKVEALLLHDQGEGKWTCLLKPGGSLKKDATVVFGPPENQVHARVLDDPVDGQTNRLIHIEHADLHDWLEEHGHMPLPPYIERTDTREDREDYQTVFAKSRGAIAAPTAGLHFDEALLSNIRDLGVEVLHITLHVGYGTFQPIQTQNVSDHQMFEETYEISEAVAKKINQALAEKRRVIACGTTCVRTLESAAVDGKVQAGRNHTRLFIYPPYPFQVVSGLITNFHLPRTTLLLLVDAFLGGGKLIPLYKEAAREKYQFYSYGDAMLIL